MKKTFIYLSVITFCVFSQFTPSLAAQPVREKKWHVGADASMSVVPSFALNKHQQQYELGLSFGRTLTPFFHLGLGASYVFYSSSADGLPVWINPRLYFSRNVSSVYLDLRLGGMVYSPKKVMNEKLIRASVGLLSFGELTLGYQLKEHVMMGIYVNSYGVDEWQREGKWLEAEQPFAVGLKLGYEF